MTSHVKDLAKSGMKERLVEIVIPLWIDFVPAPVKKEEWPKELPMPPKNTQIILPGDNFFNIVARDKDTLNGYSLSYDNKKQELYWREN